MLHKSDQQLSAAGRENFIFFHRPLDGVRFTGEKALFCSATIITQDPLRQIIRKSGKQSVFAKPSYFPMLSLRVITTFILFVMAFDSIYSMPKAWKTSAETIWKRDELLEFTEYVYEQIPPDAVSFGEGVPELMSMI